MTEEIDPARLHAYRRGRLIDAMSAAGLDAMLLLGPVNLRYAGIAQPVADAMRQHYEATCAVVAATGDVIVFTDYLDGVTDAHDLTRPALPLEEPEGAAILADALREVAPGLQRVGIDEYTGPLLGIREALGGVEVVDAALATGPARLIKGPDEIGCIRRAQRINELAMYDVEAALRPGVRQTELSGLFLERVFELGASSSTIDPIWNVTPLSVADGTVTANGDVGFPLASNDRFLREGDLILCDTGINWGGYHSDFGKTWICGVDRRPTAAQQDCFEEWAALMRAVYAAIKPGVSCADLVVAAAAITPKHALRHYYLGHGTGCDAAEPPFIGSDLGAAYDRSVVLVPGMVFVLEPVVWHDGVGGYRSEEVVAVTEDGFELLSSYGHTPFSGAQVR